MRAVSVATALDARMHAAFPVIVQFSAVGYRCATVPRGNVMHHWTGVDSPYVFLRIFNCKRFHALLFAADSYHMREQT